MRRWIAAHAVTACGFDGGRIQEGEPVQVIEIGGLPPRFRCQQHAQGQVNWDEVEASKHRPEPAISSVGFTRMSQVRMPFDAKAAAAGERDE